MRTQNYWRVNKMIDLTNLSSSEISNLKVEKEKELQEAIKAKTEVEIARTAKRKEIMKLRLEVSDLDLGVDKASCVVQTIRSDIRILTDRFFQARNTEM
jgi:hypothetical protein